VFGNETPLVGKRPVEELAAATHLIILVTPVLQFLQATLQIAASAQSRANLELWNVVSLVGVRFLILLVHGYFLLTKSKRIWMKWLVMPSITNRSLALVHNDKVIS
jgi:hypothetical protein